MPAKTPLASDNIDVPAACTVPFHPYCGDVVTHTRNVSEYMLVLALCLVTWFCYNFDIHEAILIIFDRNVTLFDCLLPQ